MHFCVRESAREFVRTQYGLTTLYVCVNVPLAKHEGIFRSSGFRASVEFARDLFDAGGPVNLADVRLRSRTRATINSSKC